MPSVCLIVIATAGYPPLANRLIQSARRHLAPQQPGHFLLLTDQPQFFAADSEIEDDVTCRQIAHAPWPGVTLRRYHMILEYSDFLSRFDYVLYCDADSLFVGTVNINVLGALTAVIHPGYSGKHRRTLPYEKRRNSRAFVSPHEGRTYFCGGVQGGSPSVYLKAAEAIASAVDTDAEAGITAVWHDESHWNRYLINNPATAVLPCSYCWPEGWHPRGDAKILALDKDHQSIRHASTFA